MKIVAVTQARMSSTRLPGKVMKQVDGKTLLEIHIERILQSRRITELVVATTTELEDEAIALLAARLSVKFYRGSLNNVLDRFYQAVAPLSPDYVVRLTSDCPLIDATLIDAVIDFTVDANVDYCSNTLEPVYPDGMDVEVMRFEALEAAWKNATLKSEQEHVTPYIYKNSDYMQGQLFTAKAFGLTTGNYSHVRLTVDEPRDLEVITRVVADLGLNKDWKTYADYYLTQPTIQALNANTTRNEGYSKSIKQDNL